MVSKQLYICGGILKGIARGAKTQIEQISGIKREIFQ